MGVLLGQRCGCNQLLVQVGANRSEASLVGDIVDAVPDPVRSDVLVIARLPDGAGVLRQSRETLTSLMHLGRDEARLGQYIALNVRSG